MRILTLNLRAGGGTRIPALVEALVARDADVLVLTEFRIGPSGTRLLDLLRQHRYEVHLHNDPPAGTNSAVIVSRLPLTSERSPHHRIVAAELHGIQLRGIYLPLNQAKVEFWEEHFGRVLGSLRDEPAILIGDFNTGAADERQSLVRFAAEDRYEAMFRQGWVDPVRVVGEPPEFTWFSQVGNGFVIDHALVSSALADRVTHASVDSGPRLAKLTDHSAVVLDLA